MDHKIEEDPKDDVMFSSGDSGIVNEKIDNSLKSSLHGWREFCVLGSKLLKWEQPYYPVIVFGAISMVFFFIWYLDPSLITGVSMFMLMGFILDYTVPFASPMIFPPANWNSKKEKEFTAACNGLTEVQSRVDGSLQKMRKLKDTNPWLYVSIATVSLSTLAWIGNQMHNLMLAYFAVMIVASLPGLNHHGLITKGISAIKNLRKKSKDQ